MPYTGHPIEKPKTPAAERVWELLSIFQQAEDGWLTLVDAIAEGYSSAWYDQDKVLKDIAAQIQKDRDRACFVVSILTAGVAGGLLGGVASGAFRLGKDPSLLDILKQSFLTNAASDGASQFGGSAVSYFQSHGSDVFSSPGTEPSTYSAMMQKNVRLFFATLHDHVAGIVRDLESGTMAAGWGEKWYQCYTTLPCIENYPSAADIAGHDFEKEAGLCLWIAWGAERDLAYWNKAWQTVSNSPRAGIYGASIEYMKYLNDISRWDPIIDAIGDIDPQLELQLTRSVVFSGTRQTHLDVRALKNLGIHSKIRSAQAMSAAVAAQGPLNAASARSFLKTMNDLPS